MQERVILCKDVYPMRKHVKQCKNRVIQREKVSSNTRNVLYNATNVIGDILQDKQAEKIFSLRKKMI